MSGREIIGRLRALTGLPARERQTASPEPPFSAAGRGWRLWLPSRLEPERALLEAAFSRALRLCLAGVLLWIGFILAAVPLLRVLDPPSSSLMLVRRLGGAPVRETWRPLSQVSPYVVQAIVAAEDGNFCRHWGIDFGEVAAAVSRARNGTPRGASTLSMQTVKNLFLWPGKSYLRKALEIPLTLWLELWLPKRRIFEIYVNIAEWGRGAFGIEAAARVHFGKSAAALSPREAALLAAALPNPFVRRPGSPGPHVQGAATRILQRMRANSGATSCIARRPA